jgi:hypothetical protein
VAVAAPGFRDVRLGDDAPTTWSHADFWESGNLRMAGPPRDVLVPGSGHAVCVVGFQADDDEPAGGHFVFRNSWGRDFARAANTTIGTPTIPFSPLRGFGTLPAEYVERHCWEAVSFARQA